MSGISLKAQNIIPLSLLVTIQLMTVYCIGYQGFDFSHLDFLQETSGVMVGVGVLAALLSYLLPAELKNSLVFMCWKNVLPGHRFIQLSENDARIESDRLMARVPNYDELRSDHTAQNSYWYREFYRPNIDKSEVASAHKSFLLYRDAAAVSTLLAVIFVVAKFVLTTKLSGVDIHSGWVFILAAVGFILAGNNTGHRLVTSAVAIGLCKQL